MIKFMPHIPHPDDAGESNSTELPAVVMVADVAEMLSLPHVQGYLTPPACVDVEDTANWQRPEFKRYSITRSLEGWDPYSNACSLFVEYNGAPAVLIGFLQGVLLSELLRELPLYHRPARQVKK